MVCGGGASLPIHGSPFGTGSAATPQHLRCGMICFYERSLAWTRDKKISIHDSVAGGLRIDPKSLQVSLAPFPLYGVPGPYSGHYSGNGVFPAEKLSFC